MPNRRERLAARAIARKRPTDRGVAVHEAGHAVGRVLTAEQLGYSLEDAIDRIDVGVASGGRSVSLDGRAKLISQAVTFGPKFSRELLDFFKASKPGSEVEFTWSEQITIVARAREAGIDVDGWFRAKALSTIMGPMAEAKHLGKSFDGVLDDYSAEDDLKQTVAEGHLCGMTPEQILAVVGEVGAVAQREISRPEVWEAILALADKLKPGRMSGREAVAIILRVLKHRSTPPLSR